MPRSDSDAVAARPTIEQEMAKFQGFSVKDGEPSDGSQTAAEAATLADVEKAAAEAKAAQAANDKQRDPKAAKPVELSEDEQTAAVEAAQEAAGDEELTDEQKAKAIADATAAKQKDHKGAKKDVQSRINHYRRQAGEAERRASTAEGALEEMRRRMDGMEARLTGGDKGGKTATNPDAEPDSTDYEFGELDPKYVRALARYEARQEQASLSKKAGDETKTETAKREQAEFRKKMDDVVANGAEKYDDFEEVVLDGAKDGTWALSETVAKLAAESEVGHEVLYHLASDPKEAARIFGLSPMGQAAAFGRLEAKFSSESSDATAQQQQAKPVKQAAVKTTKAPPPVKPARGAGGSQQVAGDTSDFKAFEALAMKR